MNPQQQLERLERSIADELIRRDKQRKGWEYHFTSQGKTLADANEYQRQSMTWEEEDHLRAVEAAGRRREQLIQSIAHNS